MLHPAPSLYRNSSMGMGGETSSIAFETAALSILRTQLLIADLQRDLRYLQEEADAGTIDRATN